MNGTLRQDAERIVADAIAAVQPDAAVQRALAGRTFDGRVVLVAVGKAAWRMARTACACLGNQVEAGVVVTKYGHDEGPIDRCACFEAGHPVPDENSFAGTRAVIDLVSGAGPSDTVLFLLSGGGSSLFEDPLVSPDELQDITRQLLNCGASIVEVNTIRKRLSKVKGGRFAQLCAPASVFSIVLSDVVGDPLDMIASGPSHPDSSTAADAFAIVEKYGLTLSESARELLGRETPKTLGNVESIITGSVRELCAAAAKSCKELGYQPHMLTDQLCCQAKDAGAYLANVLRQHVEDAKESSDGASLREGKGVAFIAGGETVVKVRGTGLGGRNQELALSAAQGIAGLKGAAVFSVGSDGTDGPTDAAGGYVDCDTCAELADLGICIQDVLDENDSYHALQQVGGLIVTGPTGTNVNDVAVALLAGDCLP